MASRSMLSGDKRREDRPSLGTGMAEKAAKSIEGRKKRECEQYKAAGLKPPKHCK